MFYEGIRTAKECINSISELENKCLRFKKIKREQMLSKMIERCIKLISDQEIKERTKIKE